MGARVSDRIAAIAESATLAVDAKAKALKAAGRPVIGFGAGEPDFPTPDYIVEAAVAGCRDPKNHRYTPVAGLPELRAAIAAKTLRDTGYAGRGQLRYWSPTAASRPSTTPSPRCSIPGDEVLLIAPYWTTYPEAIKLAGGVPVEVIDRRDERLPGHRRATRRRPHATHQGPAVRLAVQPDRRRLPARPGRARSASGPPSNGLWVVTDEIYEHLVYGDARNVSIATEVPDLADRVVILNGVAKTYAMTGWRVGWLIGPPT